MTVRRHNIIEIEAELRHETDKARLLYDGEITAWVPKTQSHDNKDGTFSMPEWLAMEKGFI